MTKGRENETLARLKEFSSKIKSREVKGDKDNWMNNQLRFHIDSQKAYEVNKASAGMMANQERFEAFITGGNENKRYANAYAKVKRPDLGEDVVQSMNIEEIVSMKELIEMAKEKKD
jgi:hypothetical protein